MQNETQQSEQLADGRAGKRVGDHLYMHVSALSTLSPDQQSIITQASELARLTEGDHFNVVKLSQQGDDLFHHAHCYRSASRIRLPKQRLRHSSRRPDNGTHCLPTAIHAISAVMPVPYALTLASLRQRLRSGQLSPVQLVRDVLANAAEGDRHHAWILRLPEQAALAACRT